MFSYKNKLDPNLKEAINDNLHKNYRVIIKCFSLLDKIKKKIHSLRCEVISTLPSLNCICANLSLRAITRLAEYPEVRYISFDGLALLCGNTIQSSNRIKNYKTVKFTGKNVGVGIIDTGVYPHSDLLHPNNKIKKFLDLINDYKYPYDDNGHGTFMAGLICSSGFASKGKFSGIALGSHIYSIKAFNELGRGFVSDILKAIEILISESVDYNIKVLCLPFETLEYNKFILSLFSKLFDKCVKNGITVIVPSGHNGNITNSITGISTLSNCITVGGVDSRKEITPYKYSSSGPCRKLEKPDLVAACVNITSLNTNKGYISERNGMKLYPSSLDEPYTNFTGTSCAVAFISGICTLLIEKNPNLTFKDVVSLLKLSCELKNIPKEQQGAGMIDFSSLFE